jgi:hypothetical protein
MAHQCPWCPIRHTWLAELEYHMREDHQSDHGDRIDDRLPDVARPSNGRKNVKAAASGER